MQELLEAQSPTNNKKKGKKLEKKLKPVSSISVLKTNSANDEEELEMAKKHSTVQTTANKKRITHLETAESKCGAF